MSELAGTWVHDEDRTQILKINSVGGFDMEGVDADGFIRALSTERIRANGETLEGAGMVSIPDPNATTWNYRDIRFDFDYDKGDLSEVGSIPVFVGGERGSRVIFFTNPDLSPRFGFEKVTADSRGGVGVLSR